MQSEEVGNPYQSPMTMGAQKPVQSERQDSRLRGAMMAVIWGIFGIGIIPGFKLLIALLNLRATGSQLDFRNELDLLFLTIPGAVILGFAFGGAAWANYFPARGLGFIRCLLLVGGGTLLGLFGVALAAPFFGIEQRRGSFPLSHQIYFMLGSSIAPCVIASVIAGLKHSKATTEDSVAA